MRRVVGLSCWRQRGSSLRKQTLRMVESARPLMTPRADLANGVAGVVVVRGTPLDGERDGPNRRRSRKPTSAKVVAVGVQRSSLYILYTLPPNTEPRLEPEQANGTRASAIARHGERAAGLGRVHTRTTGPRESTPPLSYRTDCTRRHGGRRRAPPPPIALS